MPLDGKEIDFYIAPKPDLSRPSLEALAYILRHKEEWPKGHVWNYADILQRTRCGTAGCAIGVARLMWGGFETEFFCSNSSEWLGRPISDVTSSSIFAAGICDHPITPEVVASRIEDHLAGRPIRYLVENDRA